MRAGIALACFMAMPLLAAVPDEVGVTGTWTLSGEVSGVTVNDTCPLTLKDPALTGTCDTSTGKYNTTGKIDGKTVTFKHGGNYQGTDLTITYTGKLNADGSMSGTMDVDPFNVTGSFSAKKDTTAPAS